MGDAGVLPWAEEWRFLSRRFHGLAVIAGATSCGGGGGGSGAGRTTGSSESATEARTSVEARLRRLRLGLRLRQAGAVSGVLEVAHELHS
ncbi:hypothetical protein GUJ93_ZPchr0008g13350 [Zizania palustris]|uniref:Uncharacterized protein n=1 Tax=Zizania palustris TaxID=103762 RepID=A0A8J5RUK9_ZIZPA|nr:hypothetical protein GUJ93_ZPchr0008g13350 [Zizania palustris]